MATWNTLPREMQQMVLQALVKLCQEERAVHAGGKRGTRHRLAGHATVCRDWQEAIEPANFASLEIKTKHLADFENYMRGDRRRYLRRLWFRVELVPTKSRYTEQDKVDEEEDNNANFTIAVYDLFRILSRWGRSAGPGGGGGGSSPLHPGLELELGAHAPNDRKYVFGDPGIQSDRDYSVGELDFCFVDGNKKFSYPSPLPEVHVVTSFSILRRTRRNFAPQALLTIFDSLPSVCEVRYEPWYFVNADSQVDVDESFGRYLRHWPSSIKRLSIFEHCNEFRRHFPNDYLHFNDDGWEDEGDWVDDGPDGGHAHHHNHHHHHHHLHPHDATEEPGEWIPEDGSSHANEDGWETANEDDDDDDDAENQMDIDVEDTPGTVGTVPGGPIPSHWTPLVEQVGHQLMNELLAATTSQPNPTVGTAQAVAATIAAGAAAVVAAVVPTDPDDPAAAHEDDVQYGELPHLGLGLLFVRPSQQWEELSVSGLIDARDFFELFYTKPEAGTSLPSWEHLRWLTLTSSTLLGVADDGWDAANELLQAAGRAAMRMPRLRVMELYCTDNRGGVVFRYQVTDSSTAIEWQSAWAPKTVDTVVALEGGDEAAANPAPVPAPTDAATTTPAPDEPFRLSSRVKETWARVAKRHTRNDLDPVFEEVLDQFEGPFQFIHSHLVTREMVLAEISSRDILRRRDLPRPRMRLGPSAAGGGARDDGGGDADDLWPPQ